MSKSAYFFHAAAAEREKKIHQITRQRLTDYGPLLIKLNFNPYFL